MQLSIYAVLYITLLQKGVTKQINITVYPGSLLHYLFTLTLAGGIFSVALLSERSLPPNSRWHLSR